MHQSFQSTKRWRLALMFAAVAAATACGGGSDPAAPAPAPTPSAPAPSPAAPAPTPATPAPAPAASTPTAPAPTPPASTPTAPAPTPPASTPTAPAPTPPASTPTAPAPTPAASSPTAPAPAPNASAPMPAPTLPPPAAPPATGTINSINVTGFGLPGNRSLQFRIPSGAAPTAGRPLVIYLHGNGGTSEIPALLSAQTDAKGMAVVALQGLVFNGTTNWEFRMDGRYAASQAGVRPPQGPDDVQFISDVIDRATAAANPLLSTKIDPSKVFVVGYSRGAGMAFVAYADPRTKNKIAAIAPVSGTFYCDMATPNVGTFPNGSAPPADADANCGAVCSSAHRRHASWASGARLPTGSSDRLSWKARLQASSTQRLGFGQRKRPAHAHGRSP
jgi:predicted esterase